MSLLHRAAGLGLAALLAGTAPAQQSAATVPQTTLRIAMTAADVLTTGMPNNGFDGIRFLGCPAFEGLVLWGLPRADRLATRRPGLAERREQDAAAPKTRILHPRRGVKFHDGTALSGWSTIRPGSTSSTT